MWSLCSERYRTARKPSVLCWVECCLTRPASPPFRKPSKAKISTVRLIKSCSSLMSSMHLAGDPVELVAVVEVISRSGKADEYGGVAYVASLADDVPSSENIAYYARLVSERATERRLLEGARSIIDMTASGEQSLRELIEFAESTVYQIGQQKQTGDRRQMSEVVDEEFIPIQQRLANSGGEVTGISTGLVDLDKILAGLAAHRPSSSWRLVLRWERPHWRSTSHGVSRWKAMESD